MILYLSTVSATAEDYFDRVTVASNGRLTRFDHSPITVYVGTISAPEELKSEYYNDLEESILLWEEASGGILRFERVNSLNDADIRLNWTHKPMGLYRSYRIGEANLVYVDSRKFYVEIVILLRDFNTMKLLPHDTIKTAILHELGHAVGLWGHSQNPRDVMFHTTSAKKPTERDVATLQKVYSTPVGTPYHRDAIASLNAELSEALDNWEKARLHYLLGSVYADLEDYDAAINNLQKAIEIAPDSPKYSARLAMIFDKKGMYSQAIAQYTEAIKSHPSADLYGRLGALYLLFGDFEKAIQCYQSGLRLDANSSALKHNIFATYHRWGFKLIEEARYSEALKVLDTALVYHPFSYILLYDQAVAYSGAKQYKRAIAQYKLVLDIEPDFSPARIGIASALNNLGAQQAQSKAWNKAVKLYNEALQWDAECWQAGQNLESTYLRLGWEKNKEGKLNRAIAEYKRALALNPNNAEAHNYLGVVFSQQKRYDEAIAEFETALALKSQFEDAASNLKYIRREKILAKFKPFLSVFGILLVSCVIVTFSIKRAKKYI